tara:strand:+ start:322 stop:1473 length:1152 start_codon:yes stop_codon:yes gene_type:complete
METFKKIKNKKTHTKSRQLKTTLDQKHKTKLLLFNEIKAKLPELKITHQHLTQKLLDFKTQDLTEADFDERYNMKVKIDKINQEIADIESNGAYYDYLLDSTSLLYAYNNLAYTTEDNKTVVDFFGSNKPKKYVSNVPSKKHQIMNDFIKLTDENFIPKPEEISLEKLDLCKTCNERRIIRHKKGVLLCPKCGGIEKILVDINTPSFKEPPREVTYFAYKKINHANEFLSQFQAKESTDINEKIYNNILAELKKERYNDITKITANKVREVLKKLELTKYYEHCHYIMNRLSGRPAPILDSILEDKLRNMFKQVQGPWLKYCPNKRANFFSYPYIFFKFFQLLEEDEYLPYCRLLKSREKLHEHDEVWKKICKELNWQFIPTV